MYGKFVEFFTHLTLSPPVFGIGVALEALAAIDLLVSRTLRDIIRRPHVYIKRLIHIIRGTLPSYWCTVSAGFLHTSFLPIVSPLIIYHSLYKLLLLLSAVASVLVVVIIIIILTSRERFRTYGRRRKI